MTTRDDKYYFTSKVIGSACEEGADYRINPHVKALFFSLCLRKKFNLPISWITTEILLELGNGVHGDFWKESYLSESLEEDGYSYKSSRVKRDSMTSLLECADVSAGDCIGKVKIVTTQDEKALFADLVKLLKSPAVVIDATEASKE